MAGAHFCNVYKLAAVSSHQRGDIEETMLCCVDYID